MSAALPKIAPRTTCHTPVGLTRPVTTSMYEVYPPRLPSATDIPQKVNPIDPSPYRRTVALETILPHHQNDVRSMRMKQREHHRYHNAWSKYYYGSTPEQEAYRSYTRNILKQQMADREIKRKQDFEVNKQESIEVTGRDVRDRVQDMERQHTKHEFLKTYRDENKNLMEWKWKSREATKLDMNRYDREQLRYNPINWSCTLK